MERARVRVDDGVNETGLRRVGWVHIGRWLFTRVVRAAREEWNNGNPRKETTEWSERATDSKANATANRTRPWCSRATEEDDREMNRRDNRNRYKGRLMGNSSGIARELG